MARILKWETFDLADNTADQRVLSPRIFFNAVYFDGSLSVNQIAFRPNVGAGTTARTFRAHWGLYSNNNGTLSLANSASWSTAASAAASFHTMGLSAAQDITPGTWYMAWAMEVNGAVTINVMVRSNTNQMPDDGILNNYDGPFFFGTYSNVGTTLPASVATSDLNKSVTNPIASVSTVPLVGSIYVILSA